MQKKIIIIGTAVIALISIGVWYLTHDKTSTTTIELTDTQTISNEDPIDIVFDFYGQWIAETIATTTDPFLSGLSQDPLLSATLRKRLEDPNNRTGLEPNMVDAVLCQNKVPDAVSAKVLYETAEETRILVLAKDREAAGEAIVTLRAQGGGWYIDDILCSRGEFDAPREFSFDTEGNLLKQVPAPYNPENWHVVFTQNGTPGHAAPLFFSATSTCTWLDGTEAICQPDTFTEAAKVRVQGSMTESGVEVAKMQFLP